MSRSGAAFKAEPVYHNKNLANHHGSVVFMDKEINLMGMVGLWRSGLVQSWEANIIDR